MQPKEEMPTATERMSANQNCPRKCCQLIVSQPSHNYCFYLWHIPLIFPVFVSQLTFGESCYVLLFVLFFKSVIHILATNLTPVSSCTLNLLDLKAGHAQPSAYVLFSLASFSSLPLLLGKYFQKTSSKMYAGSPEVYMIFFIKKINLHCGHPWTLFDTLNLWWF